MLVKRVPSNYPLILVKLLQLIWRSGINLWAPDLQTSCRYPVFLFCFCFFFERGGTFTSHGVREWLTPSVFTICCCILISSIHSLFIHLQKGTSPVQYIAGHLSKIYGLDWSPVNEYHLATASQDCHVKVRIMITNIYRWYSCILISYLCCSGSPMCSCLVTWFAIGWYQSSQVIRQSHLHDHTLIIILSAPFILVLGCDEPSSAREQAYLRISSMEGQIHGEWEVSSPGLAESLAVIGWC